MSELTAGVSREKALETLKKYNSDPFHIRHGLTVSAIMGWFADDLGYGEDKEFWSLVGLMHDVDFEKWPEEHCVKAPELLEEAGFTPTFIHAVCSHGWGMTGTDAKPELEMEKVLNTMPGDQKVQAERVLELNPEHPVFAKLKELFGSQPEKVKSYADLLYNQALLVEGLPIEDPVAFTNAVCALMTE